MVLSPNGDHDTFMFQSAWTEDDFSNLVDFGFTLNDSAISLNAPSSSPGSGPAAVPGGQTCHQVSGNNNKGGAGDVRQGVVMQNTFNDSHQPQTQQQQQQQQHHVQDHHLMANGNGNAIDGQNHITASGSAQPPPPPQTTAFNHHHHHHHQQQQQQQQQQQYQVQKEAVQPSLLQTLPSQQHHIDYSQGYSHGQTHSVPPTPTSAEMHQGLGIPQRYDQHQQFMLQGAPDEMAAFTPLISPDMTPLEQEFRMMPEYSLPSQYFTPLTSPAIEAMNMPQSMLQSLTQGYDVSSVAMARQTSQEQTYMFQQRTMHTPRNENHNNNNINNNNNNVNNNSNEAAAATPTSTTTNQPPSTSRTTTSASPAIMDGAGTAIRAGSGTFDVNKGNAPTGMGQTSPAPSAPPAGAGSPAAAAAAAQSCFPRSQAQAAFAKGRSSMRAAAGMNRARQSPSNLAQKRKVGEPEQQQVQQQQQEFESLMPPPALPGPSRRTSLVNEIMSTSNQNMTAAVTPATLMRLQRRKSSTTSTSIAGPSRRGSQQRLVPQTQLQEDQPMADLQLPAEAIPITSSSSATATATSMSASTPATAIASPFSSSLNHENKTSTNATASASPEPTRTLISSTSSSQSPPGNLQAASSSPHANGGIVKRAGSGTNLRKSGASASTSASPSIAPKRKHSARSLSVLTPRLGPGTGASGGGGGTAGPSPAIRPKLSPCIPANGGGATTPGTPGASAAAAAGGGGGGVAGRGMMDSYDLASKSNYQRILDGTLLPGVSYPETLTENLSSKRKNHKLAEQGRRNRINAALKEMEMLIPAEFAREFSQKRKGKEEAERDGGSMSPPASATSSSGKANQVISKASTVELAIVYIKALQEEIRVMKEGSQGQEGKKEGEEDEQGKEDDKKQHDQEREKMEQ